MYLLILDQLGEKQAESLAQVIRKAIDIKPELIRHGYDSCGFSTLTVTYSSKQDAQKVGTFLLTVNEDLHVKLESSSLQMMNVAYSAWVIDPSESSRAYLDRYLTGYQQDEKD